MLIANGALRPKSEAPRKTLAGVVRGTTSYINTSDTADTTTILRLQRLAACGLPEWRADLVASLAWGGTANG